MPAFLRHIITGEIRKLESWTPEWERARMERDGNGYPVWEETGAHDAAPEVYAHPDEVASRESHGVHPLSDVTADGVPTSVAGAAKLVGRDPGEAPVAPGPPVVTVPQSSRVDKPESSAAPEKPKAPVPAAAEPEAK